MQNNELSVYTDSFTPEIAVKEVLKLKKCFPAQDSTFFDVLIDRMKENGFTDQRIKDAINNVIDNHVYPTLQIANIISWDKRIKLYDYHEVLAKVNNLEAKFDNFSKVKLKNKIFWIKKSDKEKYNIKDEIL